MFYIFIQDEPTIQKRKREIHNRLVLSGSICRDRDFKGTHNSAVEGTGRMELALPRS